MWHRPKRTERIEVVITFPAGGDLLTCVMSEQITQVHGPRFPFENTDQFLT
jgi:hypothetical protein